MAPAVRDGHVGSFRIQAASHAECRSFNALLHYGIAPCHLYFIQIQCFAARTDTEILVIAFHHQFRLSVLQRPDQCALRRSLIQICCARVRRIAAINVNRPARASAVVPCNSDHRQRACGRCLGRHNADITSVTSQLYSLIAVYCFSCINSTGFKSVTGKFCIAIAAWYFEPIRRKHIGRCRRVQLASCEGCQRKRHRK